MGEQREDRRSHLETDLLSLTAVAHEVLYLWCADRWAELGDVSLNADPIEHTEANNFEKRHDHVHPRVGKMARPRALFGRFR